ncbi:hypothetical protein PENTCL1PPCAC_21800, partial [Pristionchus entomophagus]
RIYPLMRVTLTTSDGASVTVSRQLTKHSGFIEKAITDMAVDDNAVPLSAVAVDVDDATLKLVIEWLTEHRDDALPYPEKTDEERRADDIPAWDQAFVQKWDTKEDQQQTLYAVITAADKLDIKGLLDMTCKTLANKINGKTVEEMREILQLECDFTEEELAEIRKENAWCEN